MAEPLILTSTALLTPLDGPARSTFAAIRQGQYLVDRGLIPEATLAHATAALPPDLRAALATPDLDKAIRLATLVAHQAAIAAGWSPATLSDPGTALFVGTSKGPVLTNLAALDRLRTGTPLGLLHARQVALGPHAIATLVGETLHIGGAARTYIAACASGLHALHHAAGALRRGACTRALVVAADASVHPLFEASFARLGVLAKPGPDGHRRCVPFAPEPTGFFLTEAAAAVTLERRGPGLTLDHTWIGADASHLIAIDPTTASLRHGLTQCPPGPVDFIHAHATGTPHDVHELAALRAAFGPTPPVFSHKAHLGHALGAAGLVALVLSAECHRHQITLDGSPLPAHARSLTVAQGFGGHIAVAALRS